jgi:uncharacterized protein YfcZ (UPF0381/DUF406 family)
MNNICGLCLEEMGQVPHVELLCNHFFHTECFLERENNDCVVCNQTEVEHDTIQEEDESARISRLYDSDRKLQTLLKNYKTSCSELSKVRRPLTHLIQRKKEDLHGVVDTLLEQIKTCHAQKKQEVLNSQEYKTYHSKYLRCYNLKNKLYRDYDITTYSFQYLRTKKGMKNLRRIPYGSNSPRMVRRKLRVYAYFR